MINARFNLNKFWYRWKTFKRNWYTFKLKIFDNTKKLDTERGVSNISKPATFQNLEKIDQTRFLILQSPVLTTLVLNTNIHTYINIFLLFQKIILPYKCIPIFYGDRFIPRRFLLKGCERNLKFAMKRPAKDVLSMVRLNMHIYLHICL